MKSFEETSDHLARLYDCDFNGKTKGRYRLDRNTLAILSGRQNIEQPSIEHLALWLSEKHDLLLIDLHDEFALIKCSIFRRYRKATSNVIEKVLGITCEVYENEDDE
jgi:hypothetical protein